MAAVSVVLPWSMCPMVPTFKFSFVNELEIFDDFVLLGFIEKFRENDEKTNKLCEQYDIGLS